ncbi:helix-turn-helix domain-containing protein [Enterovirga rhinocerotis]|uniref:Excisionase family DNA binding protein n=1 Tax=Enterovirga rhinocerotis TaxID=1339210 RepID=A0A4R7BWK5_9HYPH|nr:helix-turn-helix domain-containing protein [Enterovirga rhinocerotis]TDR90254.1 excisionase family DNA binding protein [Enterovirga rhinocerotis]
MLSSNTFRIIPDRAAYPLNEASVLLSISRANLYRLAKDGRIRFVKIGHRTVVPASEIDRLAQGRAA